MKKLIKNSRVLFALVLCSVMILSLSLEANAATYVKTFTKTYTNSKQLKKHTENGDSTSTCYTYKLTVKKDCTVKFDCKNVGFVGINGSNGDFVKNIFYDWYSDDVKVKESLKLKKGSYIVTFDSYGTAQGKKATIKVSTSGKYLSFDKGKKKVDYLPGDANW